LVNVSEQWRINGLNDDDDDDANDDNDDDNDDNDNFSTTKSFRVVMFTVSFVDGISAYIITSRARTHTTRITSSSQCQQ